MARPRRNPFYILLGLVGVLFTITASSYCLSVLRGVRPETATDHGGHAFERIMDRHGTAILTVELLVLAIATVGAVAVDHVDGRRELAARRSDGDAAASPRGADQP